MKTRTTLVALALLFGLTGTAQAGHRDTGDAIIGGVVGGGIGAWIGSEIGGRDAAILGGALGAAAGVALTTDGDRHRSYRDRDRYRYIDQPRYYRHDNGWHRGHYKRHHNDYDRGYRRHHYDD